MTSTPNPHRSSRVPAAVLALAALLASLAGLLLASAPVFAVYSRPPCAPITETHGLLGEEVPLGGVGGIAIDGSENVYVGENGDQSVSKFNSTKCNSENVFLERLKGLPGVRSLAVEDSTGHLYGVGRNEYVAVDNSTDVHYVAQSNAVLSAFNFEEEPDEFTENKKVSYIRNNELIGVPCGESGSELCEFSKGYEPYGGVAVNSENGAENGDIYVTATTLSIPDIVYEFKRSGRFIRGFEPGKHVPKGYLGSGESPRLGGVAVDPENGDLLVEIEEHTASAIDEFTSTGAFRLQITGPGPGEFFGQNAFSGGIAVNSAGVLYVGDDQRDQVDVWDHGAYYPIAVTGGVSGEGAEGIGKAKATLHGTVRGALNSEKGEDLEMSRCEFEYVSEASYKVGVFSGAAMAPCVLASGLNAAGQGLEEKNYSVHADVSGLESGTVYRYRLAVATNKSEEGAESVGATESFAAEAMPSVQAVSVADVSSSFADFSAKIDPLGSATTYQFQYVDAADYEAALAKQAADPYAAGASVPVPAGEIAAGDAYLSVSVQTGGLSPGTAYDYRLVASNGAGVTEGANGVFSTVPAGSPGLPDGRSYELVTPANKGDAEDMFEHIALNGEAENLDRGNASEDGEHFLLVTSAAFGPFPASGDGAYRFSRGEGGWSYQSVVSSSLGNQTIGELVFDPVDFSVVGAGDDVTTLEGVQPLVLVGPPGGPYATAASGPEGESSGLVPVEPEPVGASQGLSRVIVSDEAHDLSLCESAQEGVDKELDQGSGGLYEWSSARGCLSLVDVQSSSGGGKLISRCGAGLGLGDSGGLASAGDTHGAVSADGSKVFFTAPDPGYEGRELTGSGCWRGGTVYAPQLYMRLNGKTTVEISKPEGGGGPEYPTMYVGASENGSKVFFLTKTELTAEAVKLGLHDLELYEYDTETEAPEGERLVRVSRGDLASGPVEGKALDVPAVSADGSAVYFNAQAELTPGHQGGLYRYDTVTGETQYVAQPQGYPAVSGPGSAEHGEDPLGRWYEHETQGTVAGLDVEAPYYTTRDGGFLLFGAYRYDAADGSVVCVMCNPDGSGPIPDASFHRSHPLSVDPAGGPQRGMSEDGQYVFFDTAESLVPRDTNGKLDVYEWHEREGSASHEGTISLIGSGTDTANSYFLDSSAYEYKTPSTGPECPHDPGHRCVVEGGNVFFGSHANLVPTVDTASEGNLYDARICEPEDPCIPPPAGPPVQCEGSTCQNPPVEPIDATPTSLAFIGPSNPTQAAKCKKPKKLSHGKCVKQKAKKHGSKKAGRSAHGKGGR